MTVEPHAQPPLPLRGRVFTGLFIVLGLTGIVWGGLEWKREGLIGIGGGCGFLSCAFMLLAGRAKQRGARYGASGERTFLVLTFLGLAAALFGGVYASVREDARQRAIVESVRGMVEACRSIGNREAVTLKGRALVWDLASGSRSEVAGKLVPALLAHSSDDRITVFNCLSG